MQCVHSNISIIIEKRKQLTRQHTTTVTAAVQMWRRDALLILAHAYALNRTDHMVIAVLLLFQKIDVWFGRGLARCCWRSQSHQFSADLFCLISRKTYEKYPIHANVSEWNSKWKPVFHALLWWCVKSDCCHINVVGWFFSSSSFYCF